MEIVLDRLTEWTGLSLNELISTVSVAFILLILGFIWSAFEKHTFPAKIGFFLSICFVIVTIFVEPFSGLMSDITSYLMH